MADNFEDMVIVGYCRARNADRHGTDEVDNRREAADDDQFMAGQAYQASDWP